MPILSKIVETLTSAALRRRGIRGATIATRGGRLHALEGPGAGSLPPIVLIHGLSASSIGFAPVLTRVQPHVRQVIAIDLPGHGRSEARDRLDPDTIADAAHEALERLHGEPAIVCGNSLGGLVALRYAARHPKRVRALALLSPGGAPMSDAEVEEVRRTFHMPTTAHARAFLERVYHRMPPAAGLFARDLRAQVMRPEVQAVLSAIDASHGVAADEVRALSMPVLLVWGRSERILPASGLSFFREHLPAHARIEEPEVGHCPQLDDPGWVARRLLELARQA